MADTPTLSGERIKAASAEFSKKFTPAEKSVHVFPDNRTGARYIECHVRASKLVSLGTIDVPLDPEEQPDYRANRDVVEDSAAFEVMKQDALQRRSFSNVVAEYNTDFDAEHPLKIIGGQHRFIAMSEALAKGIDEFHGIKVYLDLTVDQRLDVQIISNTNIATSRDLLDRMLETVQGPELRDWCQSVGFLKEKQDFSSSRTRSGPVSVQLARTFVTNFYRGQDIDLRPYPVRTGIKRPHA